MSVSVPRPPIFFGDWARSHPEPMQHSETTFRFLDRVADPYFVAVREVINDWVGRYPGSHASRLLTRFGSESEQEQMGAWWELCLYTVLTASGWTLEPEPEVSGTRNRPDYLATRQPSAFYLEATSSNPATDKVAEHNRLGAVLDALQRLEISGFFLDVHWDRVGSSSPPITGLRKALSTWVSGLSREQVLADYTRGGVFALPTWRWAEHGWQLTFMAYPWGEKALASDQRLPTLGSEGSGVAETVDHVLPMQRAFRAKHDRYGALPDPYVLAYLNTSEHSATELTHFNALVGPLQGAPDGCWYTRRGPINRDVAAVIAVWGIRPSHFLTPSPTVFISPWAHTPFEAELPWPTVIIRSDGTTERRVPAQSLHELLGLPPDWPGVEPFTPG